LGANVLEICRQFAEGGPRLAHQVVTENGLHLFTSDIRTSTVAERSSISAVKERSRQSCAAKPVPLILLAMKLYAGRGIRDEADIDLLLDACGVTSVGEATEIFEHFYPNEEMARKSLEQLRGRFGTPSAGGQKRNPPSGARLIWWLPFDPFGGHGQESCGSRGGARCDRRVSPG